MFQTLADDMLWFNGPDWLTTNTEEDGQVLEMPIELRAKDRQSNHSLLTTAGNRMCNLINVEDYSDLDRLLRSTTYVLRFFTTNYVASGCPSGNLVDSRGAIVCVEKTVGFVSGFIQIVEMQRKAL